GSLVWLASAIAMMLIRAPYANKTKSNTITEQFAVSTERVLLFLVSLGGTVLPVLHLATGLVSFADFQAPGTLARLKGLVAAALEAIPPCPGEDELKALVHSEAKRLMPKRLADAAVA
ncbi:MAG: hypothetical protein AAGF44_11735, partial [Pseudomonadota bacterium]